MLSIQDAVQAVCQYMFDQLNFNHFSYRRHYGNGSTIHLVNRDEDDHGATYLKKLYGEGLYVRIPDVEQLSEKNSSALRLVGFSTSQFGIYESLDNAAIYRKQMEIAYLCNIGDRIAFCQRFDDYIEISSFGSSFYDTGTFLNFCTQNMVTFQNFIKYFRTEAKDLIEMARSGHFKRISKGTNFQRRG